jgi:glycine/D-amino acid oxidase-like deaminating enzyme
MKISQREARRFKKRVAELEQILERQRRSWVSDWPGGVNVAQHEHVSDTAFLPAVVNNCRHLGHAVVVTVDGGKLMYYALPLPVHP